MKRPHCEKTFDQLTMLVDDSNMTRETYYACPLCKSKVNIDTNIKSINLASKAKGSALHNFKSKKDTPSETSTCPHYFGYLSLFCKESEIPENCLICPRVTKCMIEKKKNDS